MIILKIRYFKGGHFAGHRDAVHRVSNDERSIFTFMIYLNSESVDFEGGTTNFLDEKTKQIQYRVVPKTGMVRHLLKLTIN
jgi:Rps23 Pro-64 3,4-dihydroxylase Tpa1-like proline 4-hydroxylase